MFKRILIANRGEIALRVIRACHKLGIEAVAVYSEADAESPHLAEADRRICIGGSRSDESYLVIEAILQAAEQTECKAIHPGYGFLSENALFAEMCRQMKIAWIGPPPHVIRLMGDKATARRTMRAAGIPIIPGSEDVVADIGRARDFARQLGYPVLLKATAGGGGKGMRACHDDAAFDDAFRQASLEAAKAFGNPGLYLEKLIEGGRHIEFQFLADSYGHAVHLGERECSVQRHHQKLVEESPSPAIDAACRQDLGARVARVMAEVGYQGAGTMEFLRDASGQLYFMEVNTRLQVEHPVTEMVTGIDIVAEQIRVACSEPLSMAQDAVAISGHAIECRINAEDPDQGFRPSPGLIERFEPPPQGPDGSVRLDTVARAGYRIPVYYDSMIAKLIVKGADRAQAIDRMLASLQAFQIVGVRTTIPVHLRILQDDSFRRGAYDTGLIASLLRAAPAGSETPEGSR